MRLIFLFISSIYFQALFTQSLHYQSQTCISNDTIGCAMLTPPLLILERDDELLMFSSKNYTFYPDTFLLYKMDEYGEVFDSTIIKVAEPLGVPVYFEEYNNEFILTTSLVGNFKTNYEDSLFRSFGFYFYDINKEELVKEIIFDSVPNQPNIGVGRTVKLSSSTYRHIFDFPNDTLRYIDITGVPDDIKLKYYEVPNDGSRVSFQDIRNLKLHPNKKDIIYYARNHMGTIRSNELGLPKVIDTAHHADIIFSGELFPFEDKIYVHESYNHWDTENNILALIISQYDSNFNLIQVDSFFEAATIEDPSGAASPSEKGIVHRDGRILFAATKPLFFGEYSNFQIYEYDLDFNLIVKHVYRAPDQYYIQQVIMLQDGTILLTGINNVHSDLDILRFFVYSLDDFELTGADENAPISWNYSIMGNPGSEFRIKVNESGQFDYQVSLLDAAGRIMMTQDLIGGMNSLRTQHLAPGTYIYQLIDKNLGAMSSGKWVKH